MGLEFRATARIQARPETIWALLTDAPAYPDWNPTVKSLDGEIALGSKVVLRATFNPKQKFSLRIVRLEPPRVMAWQGGMPLGLFKGVRTFTLTPQGDGATEFDMHEVFSGPLTGLFGRFVPDLQPSFDGFAAALKARAEADEADAA